jgi:hypothetical protein
MRAVWFIRKFELVLIVTKMKIIHPRPAQRKEPQNVKNPSCHCPTAPLTIALPFVTEMKYHNIFLEKVTIAYTETYISSGFRSIWLPPKIG